MLEPRLFGGYSESVGTSSDVIETVAYLEGVTGHGHGAFAIVGDEIHGDAVAVPVGVEIREVEHYDVAALEFSVAREPIHLERTAVDGGRYIEDPGSHLPLVHQPALVGQQCGIHRPRGGVERAGSGDLNRPIGQIQACESADDPI